MKKGIAILLFLACSVACKNSDDANNQKSETKTEMKFDKEKWKLTDPEKIYAYRDLMLQDLVKSIIATKKERPMPKQEIFDMLGKPTRTDTLYLFYEIFQEHWGLMPLHTTTLVVKLKKDETVDKVLIAE